MNAPKHKLFKEYFWIILLAFVLAATFTFPAVLNLNSQFIGDGGDNYEYASYMGLAAKHISFGAAPFTPTDFWRYPVGFDFSRGFDSYLAVTLGLILSFISGLTLAYNFTVLILMTINGMSSYIFFKFLSRSKILGIVGMTLYGYSFYALARASSHLNLLNISGIPLLALSVLRLLRKEVLGWKDFSLVFFSLFFISLGSTQYFILSILFILFYSILFFIFERSQFISLCKKILYYKKQFILPALMTLTLFVVFYFPHLKSVIDGKFILIKRADTLGALTPSLLDYVLPNSYLKVLIPKIFLSPSSRSIEKVVFLGWIEIVFFIGFFLSRIKNSLKRNFFFLFLIPFILSLGTGHGSLSYFLPYRFIADTFPFNAIAETGRYVVIFYFIVVYAIILLLNSIKSNKLKTVLITILLIFAFAERLPSSYYLVNTLKNESYIESVKTQGGKAVLDLPINFYYAPYNLLSIYYNKPIVNGYFHWSADGQKEKQFVNDYNFLNRYICSKDDPVLPSVSEKILDRNMIQKLATAQVTTIVIHKDDKFYHPVCKNVRTRINGLFPQITVVKPTYPNKPEEIIMNATEVQPSFSLFLGQDGQLFIDKVYIAPNKRANFSISRNNNNAKFDYSFDIAPNNSMLLNPKNPINEEVKAGEKITFFSQDIVENTYFSVLYRFVPHNTSPVIPYKPPIESVFDDHKASVYIINSDSLWNL